MFMPVAVFDIIGCEAERLRRPKAKTRIIGRMADQKQQAMIGRLDDPQARPYQLAADALPLIRGGDSNRAQGQTFIRGRAISDGGRTVQSMADDLSAQQRDLRKPYGLVSAQTVNQVGLIAPLKGRGRQGINRLDIGRLFLTNDKGRHSENSCINAMIVSNRSVGKTWQNSIFI